MNERDLFIAAVQIEDPAGRSAYLDQACGGDTGLRERVEALLRAFTQAGSFMQQPVATSNLPLTGADTTETCGAVIGPYKLLEQVGEGGFGVVYMAEQTEPVRRKVALKVLKPGMDTRQIVARFEAERQALAIMDHPNIARVFGGGATESGRPYFVMELVKGVPITEFCDQNHLTPRQRLELFIPVCHAVQHAHQKGIIHRDLKPSNVLVSRHDSTPVPKVIDFGVAKALGQELTDKTLFTGVAQMIGTPLYMSPEQAGMSDLDVDTRSDIYSLGVLLYELLTSTTPFSKDRFKRAAYDEIRRIIREEEPPKPSTRLSDSKDSLPSISAQRRMEPTGLTKLVRGELDWIVMKALEKDRNRRYESASGLATDVQRFLANEPVLAGPPSAIYRVRKFVARNKGPVIAAVVVLLCLVAGILGTSAGLVWAIRERDAKALALIAETNAKEDEKQARETAMTALRSLTDDIVQKRLTGKEQRLSADDKEFLRNILRQYEQFAALPGDATEQRAIRAEGHYRVAFLRHMLGEERDAEPSYREAIELYKRLIDESPTRSEFFLKLVVCYNSLGNLLGGIGRFDEAESVYTEALTITRQPPADLAAQPEFRQHLAGTLHNVGGLYHITGRQEKAESAYVEAIDIQKQLAADYPDRTAFRRDLAGSHINLGNLFKVTARDAKAETSYLAALAIYQALVTEYPQQLDSRQNLAICHHSLGALYRITNRLDEAKHAFTSALTIRKQLAAEFPARPDTRDDLASSYYSLAILFRATGPIEDAESAYGTAIEIWKELCADFPERPEFRNGLASGYNSLGKLLRSTDRANEAEAAQSNAITIQKQLVADFPDRPEFRNGLAESLASLGTVYYQAHRFADAETAYVDAVLIEKQLVDEFPNNPDIRLDLAQSQTNLGALYHDTNRMQEAVTAYSAALSLYQKLADDFASRPEYLSEVAGTHNNLGVVYCETERLEEAESSYTTALAIQKKLVEAAPSRPDMRNDLASTYGNLADLRLTARDFPAAKAFLDQAMPHSETALRANPRNPEYRQFYEKALAMLIQASAGLRNRDEAKQFAEKMRDLGWDPPGDAYNAACGLALCIPIALKDGSMTTETRDELVSFYGAEAMKMLHEAAGRGWKNADHMKTDKDLDSIRKRVDFQTFVSELESEK